MKVAIYKKDGSFATVLEGIENPKIFENEIIFNGGSISGIGENHLLLDDDVEPSHELTPDMLKLDKKNTIEIFKTIEEQQAERIANLEGALLTLMDMI